jgi:cation:H+ antiporter
MDNLSMISATGLFTVGVALLVTGGDILVRSSITLAKMFGVAPVVVGLTAVAFGTSSPELALNLVAAVNGHVELSYGNIVGSNIANIGLILGLSAMIRPMGVHESLVRREIPMLLVATVGFIALAYAPPVVSGHTTGLARLDGALLLVGFVGVFWLMLRLARKEAASKALLKAGTQAGAAKAAAGSTESRKRLIPSIALFLLGLGLLVGGGKLAEMGAVGIAFRLGMSEEMIGLTVVALATSLPELSTSLLAARRGHADLAVGNIVGSNLFNLLLVMGATSTVAPIPLPALAMSSFVVLIVLTFLIVPMSLTSGRKISRIEGGVLLAIYFGYITYEVVVSLD